MYPPGAVASHPRNLFNLSTDMVSVTSETGRRCKKNLSHESCVFPFVAVKRVTHCGDLIHRALLEYKLQVSLEAIAEL